MSDIYQSVTRAFAVLGLKVRSASAVVEALKSKGVECNMTDGLLTMKQGSTQFNVAEVLQSSFKQHPELFVGHAGEVRFKSDVPQDAKVAWIRDNGYERWAALPATDKSPGAVNVIKPTIISTELTTKEWMTLTPAEKTEAIAGWGTEGRKNVEKIMARR